MIGDVDEISNVQFTTQDIQNKVFEWRENWREDEGRSEKKWLDIYGLFKDLTYHAKGIDDLWQVIAPADVEIYIERVHGEENQKFKESLKQEYKNMIRAPLARAYIENIMNLGKDYIRSTSNLLNLADELDNPESEMKLEHAGSKYYNSLVNLADYPPIVKTLENITSLTEFYREMCNRADKKRNQTIRRANTLFTPKVSPAE